MKKNLEAGTQVGIRQISVVLRNKAGSPLVVHNFNEKAKQEIRDKQQKKAKLSLKEKRRLKREKESK